MIQLAIWLGLCVIVALVLQKRPIVILAAALILRITVPSQAGYVFVGDWQGSAAIHPATLLILIAAPFMLLAHRESFSREIGRWPGVYGVLCLVVVTSVVISVVLSGPTSVFGLTNSLIVSLLFFLLVRVVIRSEPRAAESLLRVFILVMVAQAALVLVQWALGELLPWSLAVRFPLMRPLGTFDSPLDCGFACAIAIPLLGVFRRPLAIYLMLSLLLAAVVLTESRTPTVLAVLGAIYLVFSTARTLAAVVAALIVGGAAAVVASSLPIFAGLTERLTGDDGNSSRARTQATDYIIANLGDVFVVGRGWGSSYALKGSVLQTSLESGYAILAFDIGGAIVIALLLVQLRITLSRGIVVGTRPSSLFFVVAGFAYSGITTMSAVSLIGWFVLALALSPRETAAIPSADRQLAARR